MTEHAGTSRRVFVCDEAGLADGDAVRIPREETGLGDAVAVFRDGAQFYALGDTCTHAKASLADGWAEDGEVECPVHGGRFCLRTGEALSPPVTVAAAVYPVEVREGRVWLLLPEQAPR
jgi:3-phenylpropionate/trans-cinnamate dioxygenase ferredoxin component